MNIVAIMAHPQDIAFFCGGTLRKYQEAGHCIYIVLTTGDKIPSFAETFNIPVRLLGFEPGALHDGMKERSAVLTAMRWAQADIILTNNLFDADSDHRHTAKLVADSMLIVGGKLHPADLPPVNKNPHVFYSDTLAGLGTELIYGQAAAARDPQSFYLTRGIYSNDWLEPEAYVDITKQISCKLDSLREDPVLCSGCEIQARLRGHQMGCRYAECFSRHVVRGHISDLRLLP